MPSVSYQDKDKYSAFVRIRKRHPYGYLRVHYTVVCALVCIEMFENKTIPPKEKRVPLVNGALQVHSFVGMEFRLDFSPTPSLSR